MGNIENGIIESTFLGIEDHGIMTCTLNISFGLVRQSFGGYSLDNYRDDLDRRVGTAFGCEFIKKIIETLDVKSFESLVGTYLRVKRDAGRIVEIGHIVKSSWFNPMMLAESFKVELK